jgi:hypothetical protein
MTDSRACDAARSHKKLDPEIKALRAMNHAMESLPPEARRRGLEWLVNYWCGRSDITIERTRDAA